jgi:3-phosphoshikimate 1-carboxyvinyltransferase
VNVRVPGDKSITQRALILAALADGQSRLRRLLPSEDPRSTAAVLRRLGADVPPPPDDGSEIRVHGCGLRGLEAPAGELDFRNSGTGARLMLGVLAGQELEAVVTGDASLRGRPMRRVTDPLTEMGATFEELGEADRLPIRVRGGTLHAVEHVSPVASAQVKSAVLLAGLTGGCGAAVVEPARSRDHTERMLGIVGAGVESGAQDGRWSVVLASPPERIDPLDYQVPGDPSSAAFLVASHALGVSVRELRIQDVLLNPTRTGFFDVVRRMGVHLVSAARTDVPWEPVGHLELGGRTSLRATEIAGSEVPALVDEIPVLAVLAARAEGTTKIRGAGELRLKESDRIRALAENLRSIGIDVDEMEDGLEIQGTDRPLTGSVRAFGDHRIAMAFGVLGAQPGNEIEIDDRDVAAVSFPGFWELLREVTSAGGSAHHGGGARSSAVGPVITVDGPAGSGKSTTAKEVAERLGFRHLDSGALYRALTYALLEAGIAEEAWSRMSATDFSDLGVRAHPGEGTVDLVLGGRRLGGELRSARVTAAVSTVARLPGVREWLLTVQRRIAEHGNLVADGRDMGTVVFPDADLKVFLVADLEERARRRLIQDGDRHPSPESVAAEARRIDERDRLDSERKASPLRRPEGAVELDTTHLDFEEQVEAILQHVNNLTPS